MARHPEQGPQYDWQSEGGSTHERQYPEKQQHTEESRTSKRSIWRMIRMGISVALTIAALVLTLMILVIGRHGDAGGDLALLTVSNCLYDTHLLFCSKHRRPQLTPNAG